MSALDRTPEPVTANGDPLTAPVPTLLRLLPVLLLGAAAAIMAFLISGWGTASSVRPHPLLRHVGATFVPGGHAGAGAAALPWRTGSPPSTLPFAPNPADRAPRPGEVPRLYGDGTACATGCRPAGALPGWPLQPFHQQHPLRAGLNELRPASLHVALDIQARDGQAVYAVQPGVAHVLASWGPNARVQVGNYIYWHIDPDVQSGQSVTPFSTVLGRVMRGYGHLAFSEVDASGTYVNPLRPGGRVLSPYVDHAAPQIARPVVAAGGQVVVDAYSPQTFVRQTTYTTPVLAPAAVAYRLFDRRGVPVTELRWAFRGTHLLPWSERELIYAPGAHPPGYACFATRAVCVPHWMFRVAGGLSPPLPAGLPPGHYRLTVYAWNWAGHATALDTRLTMTPSGWRPLGHFPAELFHAPGYYTRTQPYPAPGSGRSATPGEPAPARSSGGGETPDVLLGPHAP